MPEFGLRVADHYAAEPLPEKRGVVARIAADQYPAVRNAEPPGKMANSRALATAPGQDIKVAAA